MISLTIVSLLAGALVGLRFSIYVLVFVIYLATAVIALMGAAVELTWWTALDIAVGAVGLQLGYLAGSALVSGAAGYRPMPA
jgi:hypothetical protein